MSISPASTFSVALPKDLSNDFSASIKDEKIFMRPVLNSDLKKCIKLYGDPKVTSLYEDGTPKSEEAVAKIINDACTQRLKNPSPFGLYSVFKNEDGKFIGQADFFYDDQHLGEIEIGYILRKKFQGQGLGTIIGDALKKYAYVLIENGFSTQTHPIKSLVATAHPNNIASWKILEKLGLFFTHDITKFDAPRKCYKLDL